MTRLYQNNESLANIFLLRVVDPRHVLNAREKQPIRSSSALIHIKRAEKALRLRNDVVEPQLDMVEVFSNIKWKWMSETKCTKFYG